MVSNPQTEPEFVAPALQPGQRHIVEINDIAFGGEGVGRIGQFVVFVPFVAVGERVEIELTEVKRSFGRAQLLRVVASSPDRVAAKCPHYMECGGCQYQHLSYDGQLRIKRKQIADLFERVGGFKGVVVDDVVPCPRPYNYRNRIMIRSQWNKPEQRLNIGYIRSDSRFVVDIFGCEIAEEALQEPILGVRRNPPPKGGMKVTLRLPPTDWEVPNDSFFQNNFFLLPKLVEGARTRIAESGVRFLIDLYCGVGFFGIEMAKSVERFVGVEVDHQAVKFGQRNAAKKGATNGRILQGRSEDLLPLVLKDFPPGETAVLIDPPRTGCPKKSLEFLRDQGVKQILYVSCHPATLARDLETLCEDGAYRLVRVTPYDMFPQTQHVECIADLQLNPR